MIFLPEHERNEVEETVLKALQDVYRQRGKLPNILSVRLGADDGGDDQEPLEMMLVKVDGLPFYESVQDVEMDGVPGQKLRILARV